MRNRTGKFPAGFAGLLLLSTWLFTAPPASAEVWSESGIFRISRSTPVKLAGDPAYYIPQKGNTIPDFKSFVPFNNRDQARTIRETLHKSPVWIRLELQNQSPDSIRVALRLYTQSSRMTVYYKDRTDWRTIHAGHQYREKSIPGSLYEAVELKLAPGKNILYLHNESRADRWRLYSFDIVGRDELSDDLATLFDESSSFIFVLIAFLFIMVFQLVYVGLQWYYHRRPEYIDYLGYLFLIGAYFFLRYSVILRVQPVLYYLGDYLPALNDMLLVLPFLFYLRFSRHFINMKDRFPDKERQLRKVELAIGIGSAAIFIIPLVWHTPINWFLLLALMAPLFIYSLYLIRYFYLRRDEVIRFFLLGSICATTGHFLAMVLSGFPEVSFLNYLPPINITIIGLVLEMFFFNTGLGYKAKVEQDEKLKVQLEYYRQVEKNRLMQDRLQQMRDRIAGDLHDDVGSTLSSIAIYSQLAANQIEANPRETREILQKISKSTQRMMESMSDIVWAIHSRNDEGSDLFTRMEQFANEYLSLSNIQFEFHIDPSVHSYRFTMEARRNLLLLFKEIIHNAVKYSQAGMVRCTVKTEDDWLIMRVEDNGKGFDRNTVKKGHGLPGMESRSSGLGGSIQIQSDANGTVVTLTIPLSNILS